MNLPDINAGEFLKKMARRVSDNAATDRAAQLSYYFLFALFPFLFFLVTLTAYLPARGAIDDLITRLDAIMPREAMDIIRTQLTALATKQRPRFLTFGLAIALWSASRGVDALRTSLNLSYDVKESRPWWKTQSIALSVTVVTSLVMLVAVAGLALGGNAGLWVADRLGMDRVYSEVWDYARWPITAVGVMLVVALLYYFLPDVKQEWRFVTPGSILATSAWLAASWAFTLYAENFGSYDRTYGSIGGVVVLMTWLYITGLIFIVGGEINALVEHESPEGKARGARSPEEKAPPPSERPSAASPGAAKSASVAERTRDRVLGGWRKWRSRGAPESTADEASEEGAKKDVPPTEPPKASGDSKEPKVSGDH